MSVTAPHHESLESARTGERIESSAGDGKRRGRLHHDSIEQQQLGQSKFHDESTEIHRKGDRLLDNSVTSTRINESELRSMRKCSSEMHYEEIETTSDAQRKSSFEESREMSVVSRKESKGFSSDEEVIQERVKNVSKERTARYEEALSRYGVEEQQEEEHDEFSNEKMTTVSNSSNYSAQSSALKSVNYQSMKQTEIRDSVSPTRVNVDRNFIMDECENTCIISDEEIQLKCRENSGGVNVTSREVPSSGGGRSLSPVSGRNSRNEREMISSNAAKNLRLRESLREKRENVNNRKGDADKPAKSSLQPAKRNVAVSATSKSLTERNRSFRGCSKSKSSSPTTARRKSPVTDSFNLDKYIDEGMKDEVILQQEHELTKDEEGNDVQLTIQTSCKKDGHELTSRRVAKSTRVVDDASDVDEILVGNREHEVVSREVETKIEDDGSEVRIISEVRRRPDGIEYETKNVLRTTEVFDYSADVQYDESDEILESNETTERNDEGVILKTVKETRINSRGSKYILRKVYEMERTPGSPVQFSEDDEILHVEESEEEQEDGSILKIIKEKRKSPRGQEYFHRYACKNRKMTLSGIDLVGGVPFMDNLDVVVEKTEKVERDENGERVRVVSETRKRDDGSTYTFEYAVRGMKGDENYIKNTSCVGHFAPNINVSDKDELLKEDIRETLKEDGSIVRTIVQRRRAEDGLLYLRQQVMTIPKVAAPKLLIGSLDDEIIEGDVKEKILEDGTCFKSVTERRRSSTTGVHYTLRRMSKIFQYDQVRAPDEVIDENVTEEETSDGVLVKTVVRRYRRQDGSIYSTHDIQKSYTCPISVDIENSEEDELLDRVYEEESEDESGYTNRKITETRCRNDGTYYTLERTEKVCISDEKQGSSSWREGSLASGSPGDTVLKYEEHDEPLGDGMVCKTLTELRRRQNGTEYTNKTVIKSLNVLVPEWETSYVVITPQAKDDEEEENNSLFPSIGDEILYTRKRTDHDGEGNEISVVVETRRSRETGEMYNLTKKVHTTDVVVTERGEKVLAKHRGNISEHQKVGSFQKTHFEKRLKMDAEKTSSRPKLDNVRESNVKAKVNATHETSSKSESTKTNRRSSPNRPDNMRTIHHHDDTSKVLTSPDQPKKTFSPSTKHNRNVSKKLSDDGGARSTFASKSLDGSQSSESTKNHDGKMANSERHVLKNENEHGAANDQVRNSEAGNIIKKSEKDNFPTKDGHSSKTAKSSRTPEKHTPAKYASESSKSKADTKSRSGSQVKNQNVVAHGEESKWEKTRPTQFSNLRNRSGDVKQPIISMPETPVTGDAKPLLSDTSSYPLIEEVPSDSLAPEGHAEPSFIRQPSTDLKTNNAIEEEGDVFVVENCDLRRNGDNEETEVDDVTRVQSGVTTTTLNEAKKVSSTENNNNKSNESQRVPVVEPVCVEKFIHPLVDDEEKNKIRRAKGPKSNFEGDIEQLSSIGLVKKVMSRQRSTNENPNSGNDTVEVRPKRPSTTSVKTKMTPLESSPASNVTSFHSSNSLLEFTERVDSIANTEILESLLSEVETYDERKIVRARLRTLKRKIGVSTTPLKRVSPNATTHRATEEVSQNVRSNFSVTPSSVRTREQEKLFTSAVNGSSRKNSRELKERKSSAELTKTDFNSAATSSHQKTRRNKLESRESKEMNIRNTKDIRDSPGRDVGRGTVENSRTKTVKRQSSRTEGGSVKKSDSKVASCNGNNGEIKKSTDGNETVHCFTSRNVRNSPAETNKIKSSTRPASSARRKLSFEKDGKRQSSSRESTPLKDSIALIETRKSVEKKVAKTTAKANTSPTKAPSATQKPKRETSTKTSKTENKKEAGKAISEPLRHQRVGGKPAAVQSQSDMEKIISSYGAGPTDENGLPLFGLKALKKKTQGMSSISKTTSEQPTADLKKDSLFGLRALKAKTQSKKLSVEVKDDQSSNAEEVEESTSADELLSRRTTGNVDDESSAEKSSNFNDIVRLHESKSVRKSDDYNRPSSSSPRGEKPVKVLRDSFRVASDQVAEVKRTWDLQADLTVRSDAVENIIARHEKISTDAKSSTLDFNESDVRNAEQSKLSYNEEICDEEDFSELEEEEGGREETKSSPSGVTTEPMRVSITDETKLKKKTILPSRKSKFLEARKCKRTHEPTLDDSRKSYLVPRSAEEQIAAERANGVTKIEPVTSHCDSKSRRNLRSEQTGENEGSKQRLRERDFGNFRMEIISNETQHSKSAGAGSLKGKRESSSTTSTKFECRTERLKEKTGVELKKDSQSISSTGRTQISDVINRAKRSDIKNSKSLTESQKPVSVRDRRRREDDSRDGYEVRKSERKASEDLKNRRSKKSDLGAKEGITTKSDAHLGKDSLVSKYNLEEEKYSLECEENRTSKLEREKRSRCSKMLNLLPTKDDKGKYNRKKERSATATTTPFPDVTASAEKVDSSRVCFKKHKESERIPTRSASREQSPAPRSIAAEVTTRVTRDVSRSVDENDAEENKRSARGGKIERDEKKRNLCGTRSTAAAVSSFKHDSMAEDRKGEGEIGRVDRSTNVRRNERAVIFDEESHNRVNGTRNISENECKDAHFSEGKIDVVKKSTRSFQHQKKLDYNGTLVKELREGSKDPNSQVMPGNVTATSLPGYMKPRQESSRTRSKTTPDRSAEEIENILLNSNQYTRCTKRTRKMPVKYDYTYVVNVDDSAAGGSGATPYSIYFGPRENAPRKPVEDESTFQTRMERTNFASNHEENEVSKFITTDKDLTCERSDRYSVSETEGENVFANIKKEYERTIRTIDQRQPESGHNSPVKVLTNNGLTPKHNNINHLDDYAGNPYGSSFHEIKRQYEDTVRHISDEIQSKTEIDFDQDYLTESGRIHERELISAKDKSVLANDRDQNGDKVTVAFKTSENDFRSAQEKSEFESIHSENKERSSYEQNEKEFFEVEEKYHYESTERKDERSVVHFGEESNVPPSNATSREESWQVRQDSSHIEDEIRHRWKVTSGDFEESAGIISIDGRPLSSTSMESTFVRENQKRSESKVNEEFNCGGTARNSSRRLACAAGEMSPERRVSSPPKDLRPSLDSRSFLEDKTKVSGITDVLSRMGSSPPQSETESPSGREAKSLLNKFLGAQILMSGVESMMVEASNAQTTLISSTREQQREQEMQRKEVRREQDGNFAVEGAVVDPSTPGLSSPRIRPTTSPTISTNRGQQGNTVSDNLVRGIDLSEVTDDQTLNQLLNSCEEYEERRRVRQRIKSLTAEKRELQDKLKSLESGGANLPCQRTAGGSSALKGSNVEKKSVSAFEKFKQLEKSNKTQTAE